jgi:hypothetical protein
MNLPLRLERSILPVMIGMALAIGYPVGEAAAGKGDRITATINGRHVRLRRAQVCDGYTTAGVSIAAGQKPHRLGQTLRSIALACAVDITTAALPLSPEFCSIGYAEIKFRPGVPVKQWGGASADVHVTLEEFDGTHLEGTFSGTLQPEAGTTTPATVTNGRFSLLLGGDLCTSAVPAR